ncbi:MAG: helix-turn-helix transcriptional regulator [Coriobacteriales bacterium]|nr:helix-turn-helix transcriptional regulator [Coriobacteriales bacterium]
MTEDESAAPSTNRDKRVLDGLIVVIGFGLCRSWIVFCLVAPLHQPILFVTNWIYLLFGALAALMTVLFVKRLKESIERLRHLLFAATGVALVLSACIIPFSIMQNLEPLLFCGFVIGGMGAGVLQVLWGERFASYKISFSTIVAPAAAIVTAFLVSFTSLGSNLIGYVVFPLFSYLLLVVIARRQGVKVLSLFAGFTHAAENANREEATPDSRKALQDTCKQPVTTKTAGSAEEVDSKKGISLNSGAKKLMVSIMVFSALCRLFDAIPRSGLDPFAPFGGSALMSLIFTGAVFLLFAAILKHRFNPTLTYRLSLPLMVAGFVAIVLFFDTHAAFSILLINIGYEFFDILSWILFTEIARKEGAQPLRVFGFGVAFMFIGMTAGLIGGEVLTTLILSGSVQITVIAMLSILSLVVVAFLVLPDGTLQPLSNAISIEKEAPKEREDGEKTDERRDALGLRERSCMRVAEEYHLTPREGEVLVLLAYGRTLSIIARDLHIAEGTARTHMENIYRKLDVHKQQHLIDLIEDYRGP